MDAGKIAFALYARLLGADTPCQELSEVKAGLPATRRINRMGRAALAFNGNLAYCTNRHLMATFRSVESALDAACEMHRRCEELPQLAGWPIGVQIAIHAATNETALVGKAAPEREIRHHQATRPSDIDLTARFADLGSDIEIVVSESVLDAIDPGIRNHFSSIPKNHATQNAYRIKWKEFPTFRSATIAPKSIGPYSCRVILQSGSHKKTLGNNEFVVAIGRDPACHFVYKSRFVSRFHALIEIRPEGCFIKDQSSNGTRILQDDGEETYIRSTSLMLRGKGKIVFGRPVTDPATHCLDYEIFDDATQG